MAVLGEEVGVNHIFLENNKLFVPVILFVCRLGLLQAFRSPQNYRSVGEKTPSGGIQPPTKRSLGLSPTQN